MIRRASQTVCGVLLTASLLAAALFTGATASPTVAQAAWNGECELLESSSTYYRVWCDGTGPESYRAIIRCFNQNPAYPAWRWVYGEKRWYGDWRGSKAVCPTGWIIVGRGPQHNV
jgi:hypothetical protein